MLQQACSGQCGFLRGGPGNDMLRPSIRGIVQVTSCASTKTQPSPAMISAPVSETVRLRDRASAEPDWGRGVVNTVPTITNLLPARDSSTPDRTPLIGAKVSDAQTNLQKANITLFRDGTQIARTQFTYDRVTDRLRYTPPIALSLGWHTVRVVARDPQGLVSQKVWSFRIVRP